MRLEEISHNGYRWINIKEPDQDTVNYLHDNFHFHPLDLEDVLSKVQPPKIDSYHDYLFIILQFPVYHQAKRMYQRSEIFVFLSNNYLISINSGDLNTLQTFFETCKVDFTAKEKFLGKGTALLLYELVDSLLESIFPILSQKNDFVYKVEEEIFEIPEVRDMIQEIMIQKRDAINMRRILAPQKIILQELQTKYPRFISEETKIYFDDLLDKKDRIINHIDTIIAYLDVLNEANEALITRNTNRVITILTIFTVIMLPLTLITSYYGMNIRLPLQDNPNVLPYINGGLLILATGMILFFIKKRWL